MPSFESRFGVGLHSDDEEDIDIDAKVSSSTSDSSETTSKSSSSDSEESRLRDWQSTKGKMKAIEQRRVDEATIFLYECLLIKYYSPGAPSSQNQLAARNRSRNNYLPTTIMNWKVPLS